MLINLDLLKSWFFDYMMSLKDVLFIDMSHKCREICDF